MMDRSNLARRLAVALVLFVLAGASLKASPAWSGSTAQASVNAPATISSSATARPSVSPAPTVTTSPSPSPTSQQDGCWVKVNKIERIDPYHNGSRTELKNGATLDVTPLYELVKLKFTLEINVPEKDVLTFSDHARYNNGTAAKPDWIKVELKNSKFDPEEIPGKKAGTQELNYEFKLPADVDVDRDSKSLVDQTVELTLSWKCKKSGAAGLLARLNLHGKKPELGKIDGTVTEGPNKPLFQCRLSLDPPATTGRVVTGVDGHYLFENLLPGDYTVHATGVCGGKETHVAQAKSATVVAGKTSTVDFVLKPK